MKGPRMQLFTLQDYMQCKPLGNISSYGVPVYFIAFCVNNM